MVNGAVHGSKIAMARFAIAPEVLKQNMPHGSTILHRSSSRAMAIVAELHY